jgi:hypothetical protein
MKLTFHLTPLWIEFFPKRCHHVLTLSAQAVQLAEALGQGSVPPVAQGSVVEMGPALVIEASSNLDEALLRCIPAVTPMEDDTSQMKHGWISARAFPPSLGSSAAEDKVMALRENAVFVFRLSIYGGPRRVFVGFLNLLYY